MDLLNKAYYGNTIIDWFIAFSLIALSIIIGKIIYWFTSNVLKRLTKKTKTELDDIIINMVEEPLIMVGVLVCVWYSLTTLNISSDVQSVINNIFYILIIFNIAWLITRTVSALVEHYIVPITAKSETDLDDVLLPVIRTTFNVLIWALAIVIGLNNAGYNLGAILAGMGIGGLAVAMASRETITNIIGGCTVLITRPFKVNERIRVSGVDGWVQSINLNKTIVTDFYGRAHIIPNRIFIDNIIENVDNEKFYYELERFRLRHDTSSLQIQKAKEILNEIILKNDLFGDHNWITFDKIGDYSFEIEFWYGIKKWHPSDKPKYADWYQKKSIAKNQLHISIVKKFEKNKIKFALPVEGRVFPSSKHESLFSDKSDDRDE